MKCVIIGAGNLATHLAKALKKKNVGIEQIYSRTVDSAKALASKVNSGFTISFDEIDENSDIYFFCVSDAVLPELVSLFPFQNKLLVHCAGSIPMNVFQGYSTNYGVFYPFQTFSRQTDVDFSSIPICIEANSFKTQEILMNLAKQLSSKVYYLSSDEREYLHVAGVFASNFTNHMYLMAEQMLVKKNIPFEILQPLIEQTALKLNSISPYAAQTGPAKRNDLKIIEKHMKLLSDYPELKKMYSFVTNSILSNQQKKK